jgi:hypothetical protein
LSGFGTILHVDSYAVEYPRRATNYWAFAPENLTTLAHFSASSAISFPNAAGVIDIGSAPKSASRAFRLGIGKGRMPSAVALPLTNFKFEMLASRWH